MGICCYKECRRDTGTSTTSTTNNFQPIESNSDTLKLLQENNDLKRKLEDTENKCRELKNVHQHLVVREIGPRAHPVIYQQTEMQTLPMSAGMGSMVSIDNHPRSNGFERRQNVTSGSLKTTRTFKREAKKPIERQIPCEPKINEQNPDKVCVTGGRPRSSSSPQCDIEESLQTLTEKFVNINRSLEAIDPNENEGMSSFEIIPRTSTFETIPKYTSQSRRWSPLEGESGEYVYYPTRFVEKEKEIFKHLSGVWNSSSNERHEICGRKLDNSNRPNLSMLEPTVDNELMIEMVIAGEPQYGRYRNDEEGMEMIDWRNGETWERTERIIEIGC